MKYLLTTNNYKIKLDDDDYDKYSKFKWGTVGKKYKYAARGTRTNGVYKKHLLHREITKAKKNDIVDHINGDTFDNRKSNLRLVTRSGNTRNSKLRSDSKCNFKGVSKRKRKNRIIFISRIQVDKNIRLYLGQFKTELEAAKAYNEAALKYFGCEAKLNKV